MASSKSEYRDSMLTEYHYSIPVATELYEDKDYVCIFRPRINKDSHVADQGSLDFRRDWAEAGDNTEWIGGLCSVSGNATALWGPEALAERLYLAAYFGEWAFWHDDITDQAVTGEEFEIRKSDGHTMLGTEGVSTRRTTMQKAIEAKFVMMFTEADEELAAEYFDEYRIHFGVRGSDWGKWETFEEYSSFRFNEVGAAIIMPLIKIMVDTKISKQEQADIRHLTEVLCRSMYLANDYYSWRKEYQAFREQGEKGCIVNAVGVFMKEKSVDEEKAKALLRNIIIDIQEQYCVARDIFLREKAPKPHVVRILGHFELFTAGNALWHMQSPRYTGLPDHWSQLCSRAALAEADSTISTAGSGDQRKRKRAVSTSTEHSNLGASIKRTNRGKADVEMVEKNSMNETKLQGSTDQIQTRSTTVGQVGSSSVPNHFGPNGCSPTEERLVLEPYHYIASLPAKAARDELIDGLNNWYHVPKAQLHTIHEIIGFVHNASLMLDDIQDSSPTRREHPSTHMVWGISQTINSATYLYVKCVEKVSSLSEASLNAFISEMSQLHIGQSKDLHWTYHCQAPSSEAYFKQTEQKTGGLFRMASKMMQAEATRNTDLNLDSFMNLLGRYYQIRDDYQDVNISSDSLDSYNDLDQGSFTLPILHSIQCQAEEGSTELLSMLKSRTLRSGMSIEAKRFFLTRLRETRSLEYTKGTLDRLHTQLGEELEKLEERTGVENWILRLILLRLRV